MIFRSGGSSWYLGVVSIKVVGGLEAERGGGLIKNVKANFFTLNIFAASFADFKALLLTSDILRPLIILTVSIYFINSQGCCQMFKI